MKKHELITPAILLDMDALENNINSYQALCDKHGKENWPMIKTHGLSEDADGCRGNRFPVRHHR